MQLFDASIVAPHGILTDLTGFAAVSGGAEVAAVLAPFARRWNGSLTWNTGPPADPVVRARTGQRAWQRSRRSSVLGTLIALGVAVLILALPFLIQQIGNGGPGPDLEKSPPASGSKAGSP